MVTNNVTVYQFEVGLDEVFADKVRFRVNVDCVNVLMLERRMQERRMQPARGRFARFDLDRQIASTFPAHWKVGPAPVFWASQPLEPAEWLALLILIHYSY